VVEGALAAKLASAPEAYLTARAPSTTLRSLRELGRSPSPAPLRYAVAVTRGFSRIPMRSSRPITSSQKYGSSLT
jgi:hypothetical protein